MQQRE